MPKYASPEEQKIENGLKNEIIALDPGQEHLRLGMIQMEILLNITEEIIY